MIKKGELNRRRGYQMERGPLYRLGLLRVAQRIPFPLLGHPKQEQTPNRVVHALSGLEALLSVLFVKLDKSYHRLRKLRDGHETSGLDLREVGWCLTLVLAAVQKVHALRHTREIFLGRATSQFHMHAL